MALRVTTLLTGDVVSQPLDQPQRRVSSSLRPPGEHSLPWMGQTMGNLTGNAAHARKETSLSAHQIGRDFLKEKCSVRVRAGERLSPVLPVGIKTAAASLDGSSVSPVSVYVLNPINLSPKNLCVPQATSCLLHEFIQYTFMERLA